MRHFLVIFIISAFAMSAAHAQEPPQAVAGPIIKWDKPSFDFGDLKQGDKVENTFKFTNAGTAPLIITNVEVTCGCTTPKGWPRDPIPPGGKAEITVSFNSVGKYGRQNKVVKVISNSVGDQNQVVFTANVLTKDQ
ncbi:MAG: DUF1573 domain-containing protein [Cyclobacteriaceae bacterium]